MLPSRAHSPTRPPHARKGRPPARPPRARGHAAAWLAACQWAAPSAWAAPQTAPASGAPTTGATATEAETTDAAALPREAELAAARKLWYQGVAAFRQGDYEGARRAFQACYDVNPRNDVLRNLSLSEVRSGHHVSGARHLAQLLAEPGALEGDARDDAEQLLSEAKAQVGELQFYVDQDGADLVVDGETIGRSPLTSHFVPPGAHEVTVSLPGYPTVERNVFALAGVPLPVSVDLEEAKRQATATLAQAAQVDVAMPLDPGLRAGEKAVLIGGGALTAAAVAAGLIFTLRAHSDENDADLQASRLGEGACNPNAQFSLPGECDRLLETRERVDGGRRWANVAFIGAGVAGAATLGYGLWLVSRSSTPPETEESGGEAPAEEGLPTPADGQASRARPTWALGIFPDPRQPFVTLRGHF